MIRQSYLNDCELEDGASVGPFGYVRPGTVLRRGAKTGDVRRGEELGHRGRGTKIPHLSYIGDADVGEETNWGRHDHGDYDGRVKSRTTIGRRVRAGWTRVCGPVTVGDEAYTAAGSVITEDVPAGALGWRERSRRSWRSMRRGRSDL